MTPEQQKLARGAGAPATSRTYAIATLTLVAVGVFSWTAALQAVGYLQHRDRMAMYSRCLDQQRELADKLPDLWLLPGCTP